MTKSEFIAILSYPEKINFSETNQLETILEKHPYFQAAHALRLKGLKTHKAFLYNSALKKAAAISTDRSVLFEWITSEEFSQQKISEEIKDQNLNDLPEIIVENELHETLRMNDQDANRVFDPNLFSVREATESRKPLEFSPDEAHSFSEWLQLTKIKPLSKITENNPEKERKAELVDKFISESPKILPPTGTPKIENRSKTDYYFPNQLMTETLARVYLQQKNYEKAIRAYKILILKNPEKSGFFADQIRAIEKLQENRTQ